MSITSVVAAACVFQLAAAVQALRVLRVTGRWPAWVVIAAVAFLMAARRCVVFYGAVWGDPPDVLDPVSEWIALVISVTMLIGVSRISPFFVAIRRSQQQLEQRTVDLAARVRELDCLYGVSELIERHADALHTICDETARLLATSMRHPERAVTRISLDNRVFQTAAAPEPESQMACPISVDEQPIGRVQVWYRDAAGAPPAQPFLAEERRLLAAVAERLARHLEHRRAELERDALHEELHQAQKMEAVGQLSSGIAHDFNNLLTAILGHVAEARATLGPNSPARESIDTIGQAAQQARAVTDALLKFAGRMPSEKRPVNLGLLVAESTRLLRHMLPASIQLVVDVPTGAAIWVPADATQLQQVVLNLAINARDAMPNGGVLRFAVRLGPPEQGAPSATGAASGDNVAFLSVSDTGIGMPPEVLARVFDPFFTTKPRGEGTGLGLSIVHGIVEDHGGDITVRSSVGAGATFTVRLPMCSAPPALEPGSPQAVPADGGGGLIVVAENHPQVRGILVATLQSLGYEVRQAADGQGLLEVCGRARERVALLIVDLDPPGRSGLSWLRELRAAGMGMPVVAITAKADADLDTQVDDHTVILRKPFAMATLGQLVHGLIHAEEAPA